MSLTEQVTAPELNQARTASESHSTPGSKKRGRAPGTPFHGVRRRTWGRYVSEIRLPGQKTRIWLGSFGSPEMAARAYDSAAFYLKGKSAALNFPDLVEFLPRPNSASRRDIQVAAAKAALLEVPYRREPDPTRPCSTEKESTLGSDSMDWWSFVDESELNSTTSFEDVKHAPLVNPQRLETVATEEFWWSQEYDSEFLFETSF